MSFIVSCLIYVTFAGFPVMAATTSRVRLNEFHTSKPTFDQVFRAENLGLPSKQDSVREYQQAFSLGIFRRAWGL